MPRKAFVADLQNAVQGLSIAGISDVRPGGDDGEFTFRCLAEGEELVISALVPDVSNYPSNHTYMIFAPHDAPERVANILCEMPDTTSGKPIAHMLEMVARMLEAVDGDGDQQMLGSQLHDDDYGGLEDSDDDEVDEYFPEFDHIPKLAAQAQHSASFTEPTSEYRQRIRSDLKTAKSNGFKVGYQGGLMNGNGCYVSVSCRISKLGISEEAMKAWQLEPSEYLVVIFHYPSGYKSMDWIRSHDASSARQYLTIRMGISSTYKPSKQEALKAFSVLDKSGSTRDAEDPDTTSQSQEETKTGFRDSFISRPLNGLLHDRFVLLLQYRYNGMPWEGAEEFYNDHSSSTDSDLNGFEDKYFQPERTTTTYPRIVTADHILESQSKNPEHSLPLVGMQFVLRHFVRCTEFCLNCFTKLPDDLQAIKPYVCDNGLCLYQYISLGFGPSIEHEILSQPKVVDLLVAFCYVRAKYGALKDFPTGLSLMVHPTLTMEYRPPPRPNIYDPLSSTQPPTTVESKEISRTLEAQLNEFTRELLFPEKSAKCPLKKGDWIVIAKGIYKGPQHRRIADTTYWPTVRVGEAVYPAEPPARDNEQDLSGWRPNLPQPKATKPAAETSNAPENAFRAVKFHIYESNFDLLTEQEKRTAICSMLDLLPPISELKEYLSRRDHPLLSSWVERLPPASLGILRWIIASNRACIMEVDELDPDQGVDSKERVHGMPGWTQFRFAMGAPDKERRFVQAVSTTCERLKLKYPTIFAWHGSPLKNWHSIIREGLHFNDTAHGRAYGHGVYHSLDARTSMGYSSIGGDFRGFSWNNSELKIGQALALNEIVNAPGEFVASNPHLVVNQLDWIQTRYLFVRSGHDYGYSTGSQPDTPKPDECVVQDPKMTPMGTNHSAIVIPITAIPGSRRSAPAAFPKQKVPSKRRKLGTGNSRFDPINVDADVADDDDVSVATDEEDRAILLDDDDNASHSHDTPALTSGTRSKVAAFFKRSHGSKPSSQPQTDFVPGTLDYDKLPLIAQPTWATPATTKRLMKDFQDLLKIQEKEPPHELGWYVDPERTENMYQWIVEMHSFESKLPLAQDMKAQGHKSIVMELRFGHQYPMSPPFVRIIRPRFMLFSQGGGGHVTAGGAMCMQLLTNDGWSAVSSIESVLLQVRMALSSTDPRPARLEKGGRGEYGVGEAVEAYIRVCKMHGWRIPEGFEQMAYGGAPDSSVF